MEVFRDVRAVGEEADIAEAVKIAPGVAEAYKKMGLTA